MSRMSHRAVGPKDEIGNIAQTQVLPKPVANEPACAFKRFQGGAPVFFRAENGHKHLGMVKVLGNIHFGNGGKPYSGILQLSLKETRDLFLEELVHPVNSFRLHVEALSNERSASEPKHIQKIHIIQS